jgi:glycosyltransferase involved in cell wall biosynthesis
MGKATIVSDNPANREILTHGNDAWFCEMNNPNALANSIQQLAEDQALRTKLGQSAHNTFMKRASLKAQTPHIKQIVEKMIS